MKTKETGEKNLNWIKNIALILISTLLSLLFVEFLLSTFYADYFYKGKTNRSLYYSSPNLTMSQDGQSVHYVPNTKVRSIAVYYNKIEYDTRHQSNNLGFLSDVNYTKEDKRGILFVGDSFTAGVGSTRPFIPQLNHKYPDINLYSMGVTGTGIWNFYHTFKTYQNTINFDTIVVMAISDDLRRKQWTPEEANRHLFFCTEKNTEGQCIKRYPIAKLIPYDIKEENLLAHESLYITKAYALLKQKWIDFKNKKKTRKRRKTVIPDTLSYDMLYLQKIKTLADSLGKKVIFIHIPEKAEAKAGHYRCQVKKDIEDLGIKYYPILKPYHFDMRHFHKHDGHPNDKGYAYLSEIIEEILELK